MAQWEHSETINQSIPVYNIEMPITTDYVILQVRGDEHIGHKSLNINDMKQILLKEQQKYKDHMFVVNTGDMIENILKTSTGSTNELSIADPAEQLTTALKLYEDLDKDLYGSNYNTMQSCNRKNTKNARRIGVIGNHEYRSRIASGTWLNKQLYGGKGVVDGGIHCLVNLKLTNKSKKLSKTYRLYITHRLSNSTTISDSTLLNHFKEKKSLINADVYITGHYHRDFAFSDTRYDINGKVKKILYICNPSPIVGEYATVGMFNPIINGYFKNVKLPIMKNELITSIT